MRQVLFAYLALVFLLSSGPILNPLQAQNASFAASLDTFFQNRIAKKEMAGVVCIISKNGKITYEKAFGSRNLEEGLPMQKNTLFRLQSMNKAIISLAVLKLVDKGKLNLDDPAYKYFPELKNKKVGVVKDGNVTYVPADKPITLRHLISQSSGIGSSWNAGTLQSIYEQFEALTTNDYKQAVKSYLQLPLIDQPGIAWHYGWGHLVMANIIEKITDTPIKEYLDKAIFQPLGMKNTTFTLPKSRQKDLAQHYTLGSTGELRLSDQDPTYSYGTDLISTVEDYHRFCQLLLNNGYLNGKPFIKPELLKELSKPIVGLDGEAIGFQRGYAFALGVSIRVNDQKAEYKGSLGDYGWFGGFNTAFWIDPQKQIVGIILTQSDWNRYTLSKEAKNIVYSSEYYQ